MLLTEAMSMYLLDPEADEIRWGDTRLIVDRNTERLYFADGSNYSPKACDLLASDWEVVRYYYDGQSETITEPVDEGEEQGGTNG